MKMLVVYIHLTIIALHVNMQSYDGITNTDEEVSQTIAIGEEIGFRINGFEDGM